MKNKKVLFVATVVKKHINVFHLPYLQWFQEQGYETHVAARDDFNGEECIIPHCNKHFDIPFERSPLNKNNIKSYRQLKKIINENSYDIIHCHTPVAAILTRFAARKARKMGTKVIYTAHGFHFFKGALLINWLIYFPAEWICSFFTDVLITINNEDFNLSNKFMKAKRVVYVPGVGIDTSVKKSFDTTKPNIREEFRIPQNAIVLLSIGELSKRKNHKIIIEALSNINNENIYYLLCGDGPLEEFLKKMCKNLGLENRVVFAGHRKDIFEICELSDIFLFPSIQEGLPVAIMEAMRSGLPVICSNIRGNIDLIENNYNGYLCDLKNIRQFKCAIEKLVDSPDIRQIMMRNNQEKIKNFDIKEVNKLMIDIYVNL